jgi:hypothetical protein
MNNKLRLIFSYYITPDNEISFIHKLHIYLLRKYAYIFTNIDIIITIDDINNEEAINNHKNYISDFLNVDSLTFYVEQNDSYLREGNIYVKYVIDKLDEYSKNDDLIFFGHTKGLTNPQNLNNIENTKMWVSLMYFMNLDYLYEVIGKLLDVSRIDFKDYICYGSLYHIHHNTTITKYTWMYMGSFHWINPKRLINHINENNIDIDFVHKILIKNRTAAETFLPNIIDNTHVAFLNDQIYNKDTNTLTYERHDITYTEILYCACMHLQYDDYINFITFYDDEIKDITL